ncbi:MAG: hypothetical protein ACPGXY_05990 [Alphaproteobacteria bacterium]
MKLWAILMTVILATTGSACEEEEKDALSAKPSGFCAIQVGCGNSIPSIYRSMEPGTVSPTSSVVHFEAGNLKPGDGLLDMDSGFFIYRVDAPGGGIKEQN